MKLNLGKRRFLWVDLGDALWCRIHTSLGTIKDKYRRASARLSWDSGISQVRAAASDYSEQQEGNTP